MKRIIFCGSRKYIFSLKENIVKILKELDPVNTIIIHGGCTGVDTIAGIEAQKLGFCVEVFPAEWFKYGKKAGPIRNKIMLDSGIDEVYAFPYPDLEKSIGTKNMVNLAKKAGITVFVK